MGPETEKRLGGIPTRYKGREIWTTKPKDSREVSSNRKGGGLVEIKKRIKPKTGFLKARHQRRKTLKIGELIKTREKVSRYLLRQKREETTTPTQEERRVGTGGGLKPGEKSVKKGG